MWKAKNGGLSPPQLVIPVPRFERLSDFNQDLLKICDADAERIITGKNLPSPSFTLPIRLHLLALPAVPLDVVSTLRVKTNGYGRFLSG